MAAIGANLNSTPAGRIARQTFRKMGIRFSQLPTGFNNFTDKDGHPMFLVKHGVPADSTTGDNPGRVGVFIYDSANDDVWFCHSYTAASTFDITKIFD